MANNPAEIRAPSSEYLADAAFQDSANCARKTEAYANRPNNVNSSLYPSLPSNLMTNKSSADGNAVTIVSKVYPSGLIEHTDAFYSPTNVMSNTIGPVNVHPYTAPIVGDNVSISKCLSDISSLDQKQYLPIPNRE